MQSSMKFVSRPSSFVVLCALAFFAAAPRAAAQSPWRQADFAAELHRRAVAAAGKDANVIVSPWGVASLFAMLQTGARGDTARGMAFALQLGGGEPPAPDNVARTFREARIALARATNGWVWIETSDSLWIAPGFDPKPDFLARVRDAFNADARVTAMGAVGRKAINDFISEKTHGRIRNLLASPVLDDPLTRFVAVDTVWLKAVWASPFDKMATRDRVFHAPDGDIETPFLRDWRDAEILDAPECAALRLPYYGSTLEMLVLLPSPSNTLADVEARLGRPFLDRLAATPWRGTAEIALPKFEFDSDHDLRPILEPMGMGAAFDPKRADFGGIAPRLFLQTVVQKVNVAVDEIGTEAAAVSLGGTLGGLSGPPRPFVADRPFLFLIRENRTGLILFLGRVCKPVPPKETGG